MTIQTPLSALIQSRIKELGIDCQGLGLRLGYRNPLKAAGRVAALCDGQISSCKSQRALARLAEVLEVSDGIVLEALNRTKDIFAENERQEAKERRLCCERENAEWRSAFRPHAIVQTTLTVPSQITFCIITGGPERWLLIRLDASKSPVGFIRQAIQALPNMIHQTPGRPHWVPYFGDAVGIIVNYSPDRAIRFDLDGNAMEVLPAAYRLGHTRLSVGGRGIPQGTVDRLFRGEHLI